MSEDNQGLLRGFVADNKGKGSAMRLMSWVALLFAIFLAVADTFSLWGAKEVDLNLIVYFLVAAFVPKFLQKIAEGKVANYDSNTEESSEAVNTKAVQPV